MQILVTSGNPLGLSAVGSGGRTATSSYEQIARTLRQTLGPEHAALFAEPSRRSGKIDWFAEAEGNSKPVRLISASPDLRDRGMRRLDGLVHDIRSKITSLQKSDRSDERILGDMIAHALDIPSEDAVFMVGEQPVMTFWGYIKNEGRPPVSPIETLIKRWTPLLTVVQPSIEVTPPRFPDPPGKAAHVTSLAPSGARKQVSPTSGQKLEVKPRPKPRWVVAIAALIGIAALVFVVGVVLARSCVIEMPFGWGGAFASGCPTSNPPTNLGGSDDPQVEPIPDPDHSEPGTSK